MFEIGKYSTLTVDRIKSPGAYLVNDNDDDILLPNKYVPKDTNVGDDIDVFIYLDGEERPVATTLRPFILLNDFALLKANYVSSDELRSIEKEIDKQVNDSVEFALNAPEPDPTELNKYIWAEETS